MIFKPCTPQDLLEIKIAGQLDDERRQIMGNLAAHEDPDAMLQESARTIWRDDRVLACFGVWPMWAGVSRAWSMITEEMRESPLTLHRYVLAELADVEERQNLVRIEAVVRFGYSAGHRWIRSLGFQREGLMKNYGIGGAPDFHLYARTRSCPDSRKAEELPAV